METDRAEHPVRRSRRVCLYYVDFDLLASQRTPNSFEKELQSRLTYYDDDYVDFKRLLEALSPRDRGLVEAFFMGYTQRELAKRFGLAQQTVSRLLRQVGHRLRRMQRGLPWRCASATLPLDDNGSCDKED
jgi:DNA-directed RNA polymerase specialized sigma24 family protein